VSGSFRSILKKISRNVKYLTPSAASTVFHIPRKKPSIRPPDDAEKIMYRSASLARESSDDFTTVLTFALLGLALSLLAIGRAGFIDPEYMADLFLLF